MILLLLLLLLLIIILIILIIARPQYHLLSTWRFWLGLIYALFPLNLLVYGTQSCNISLITLNDGL